MSTETRRELSFDGRGINGPDVFRERVATFSQAALTNGQAKKYGPMFEAAPELLAALEEILAEVTESGRTLASCCPVNPESIPAVKVARVAVAKAKGVE